jgi:hypothetical protein
VHLTVTPLQPYQPKLTGREYTNHYPDSVHDYCIPHSQFEPIGKPVLHS